MNKSFLLPFFLIFSLPAGASAQVQVVSKTPYGPVADMNAAQAIAATFSRPMAALGSAEKMGEACPLEVLEIKDKLTAANYQDFSSASLEDFRELKPVEGRCRWQGTQTVSFEPAYPLKRSTLYAARIKKSFSYGGQALEEDAAWFFETQRPSIKESEPDNDERWLPLDTVLYAAFNMPMASARARDSIKLEETAPDGSVREVLIGVRLAKDEEVKKLWPNPWQDISTGTVIAVRPAAKLKPDCAYKLKFGAGLAAAEGNLGLGEERVINFEPYYTFRLKKLPQDACLPEYFSLVFTNPVKYTELYKHMSVEPPSAMPPLDKEREDYESYGNPRERAAHLALPYGMFGPGKVYSFKISPDFSDTFGNKLGESVEFKLGPMDYCPYWDMPTGFGILEGYLPARHPFTSVNAAELNILKSAVSQDNLIPFFRGRMEDHSLLSLPVQKGWDPSKGQHNYKLLTYLDYTGLFGPEEGGFGFLSVPAKNGTPFRALDNITRIGITLKTSQDSTLIWTSFLKTGKPAVAVPVEIRSDENKVLWTGVTDKQGFADAPGWLKLGITDWPRWQRPALWVFAKHKNGAAVMNSAWTGGVEPWRFSVNYNSSPRPRNYSAALFTERGVYRPGETVDMKGFGRKLADGDWTALDLPVVQLSIRDSRGNRVFKTTVPVSADFSSFDYAYKLSEAAPTGVWTVEASEPYEDDPSSARAVEGEEEDEYRNYDGKERPFLFTETFRVEEFKPAVFEVKARSLDVSYLAGGKFRASVEGWYLFGAPMSESKADWTLRLQSSHYEPPGKEGFSFGREFRGGSTDKLAGSGGVQLDTKGKATIEVQLENKYGGAGNALSASFEAGISDPERQRLFGRASAYVHKADLYFGIKASGGFVEAGKPWTAELIAVRPDGTPAAGLTGAGRMIKRQWLSSRRAGLGGRLEWVTETKDTEVSSFTFTGSASTETWSFTPDEGGYYIFTVAGKDEEARDTETSFSFYVFGKGDAWWAREDSDIIELVSEKYDYKPGDTAKIMVKSPYDEAQALVTVEREGVLDRWLTATKGGADFINVPIKEKYLPNAYVSVILIKGRAGEQKFSEDGETDLSKPQAKFGYLSFNVSPAGRRLALELKSDKADYRPGQEIKLGISTLDEAGKPAAGELTVFAVDEGVLSLTGYSTPDVFSGFYGPRPLNILTADSRLHVIGQRNYGEKGEARGGGGGASLAGIDLRSNFVPTAYWNPSVKTGPDGKASLSFRLPDSLTRFRLMAVANSGKRFGSGDASVTVSKPLMLRPSMPRLARAGDTFECGVVAHNYAPEAATVKVSLETAGGSVSVKGEANREVSVESGKAAEITWNCAAEKPGETVFKFRAAAGRETDGLEWKLPVRTWEPREYAATSGVSAGTAEEALQRPYPGAAGDLAIELSPTALVGLNEGARYLLEYPYGCLEQKLSRSMPVITGAELIESFGLGGLGTLKAEVQKVFDKLQDYQHPSGGFCYWAGGCWKPDPYLSAYALEAAVMGLKEGYKVDEAVLGRDADWLEKYLAAEKTDWAYPYSVSEDYAARAYAVYALAMYSRNTSAYFNQLYLKRAQVPYLAKGYMVMAAKLLGFDAQAAKKLSAEIMNQARYSPTQLHFEDPETMPWIHNSPVQTTAVMLVAMLEAEGGFPGDEKAVRWLTTEKKNKGRWRTTQENSWALQAFQTFYRRYEKEEPDFKGSALLMGGLPKPLLEKQFKGRQLASASGNFGFDPLFAGGDTARLLFSKAGAGRLYYSLRMGFVPEKRDKPASEGFEMSREIKPMDGGKAFRAGARAVVTITVKTPQDRTFVAVNDPVPAGFEIVNTEFAVEGAEDARALAGKGGRDGGWGGFERAERYDDRMLIFADYLTAGTHKYSYVVQATSPGLYYAPSGLVEGMYEPEVFARTAGSTVEIVR
ncbi:MAG: alpha-2-macroglobulin family protein [Elusimicrobiales bacterium]|nr:alpha-2-macroglobulin family protein [Elusimicrobiales bacterium]